MAAFAELSLTEILDRLASADPTPGAGPTLAWTCALAASLVEMVDLVSLRNDSGDPATIQRSRERVAALRREATKLADVDAAAYGNVLAQQRDRARPDRAQRIQQALLDAADPLVAIVQAAGEVARLAADAAARARGGVRGEAITAAMLAATVARAGADLADMNLASVPEDPRRGRAREIARAAEAAEVDAQRSGGPRSP